MPGAPSTSTLTRAKTPMVWLWVALGLVAVSVVIEVLFGTDVVYAAVGWALAGPLALLCLHFFLRADARAREAAIYSEAGAATWTYRAVVILIVLATAFAAFRLASWWGRL